MSEARYRWMVYCVLFWLAVLAGNFAWIFLARTMGTGMNLIEILLASFGMHDAAIHKWAPIIFMLPLIVAVVLWLWPYGSPGDGKPPPS